MPPAPDPEVNGVFSLPEQAMVKRKLAMRQRRIMGWKARARRIPDIFRDCDREQRAARAPSREWIGPSAIDSIARPPLYRIRRSHVHEVDAKAADAPLSRKS